MRDVAVLIFLILSALYALRQPWLGVLALCVLNFMNPHRYAWGFSLTLPVYFIVFVATILGLLLHKGDRQTILWTRETKTLFVLLVWFTFTTFIGADYPSAAQEQWAKVMKIYVSILPMLWLIRSRERLHWLLLATGISFGVIGAKGGLFALGTGFHHRVWGPPGTFYGGNNEIALALNMSLPLLWYLAGQMRYKWVKSGLYATFVLSVFSIISSWSRGGLLTFCAVIGGMILLGKRKWLVIPLIAVLVALLGPRLPEDWFARMNTISAYEEDGSVQGRFMAWNYAIERAKENPLSGGGFEAFRGLPHDAHSAYFEILGEHGFVALLLWLSLLFGTMVALERIRRKVLFLGVETWIVGCARALQLSLLAYAVGGAFLGVAYWDYFYHIVAICVLLKVFLSRLASGQSIAQPEIGQWFQFAQSEPPQAVTGATKTRMDA